MLELGKKTLLIYKIAIYYHIAKKVVCNPTAVKVYFMKSKFFDGVFLPYLIGHSNKLFKKLTSLRLTRVVFLLLDQLFFL